jgi:small subunit ribosomal protein S30
MRGSKIRIKPLKYEQEYTDTPQYPPILDVSYEARERRKRDDWHEKIRSLKTVEEKLFEINMPRYYGWKPIMLFEESIPYNSMSFAQHVTRTHFREFKDVPRYSTDLEEESQKLLEQVKPWIEDALVFEYKYRRYIFVVFVEYNGNKIVVPSPLMAPSRPLPPYLVRPAAL